MNRSTLERLYDAEAEGVFRYALALGGREDIAKDVLQEVFIKVARDGKGLALADDQRAYLFRMARNAFIDRGRRDTSWQMRGEKWGTEFGFEAREADPDQQEFASWLEEALGVLPEEQRSVVVLHLWDGMSFTEIGKICGVSQNTAASRYRYGIDKMRQRLRPLYEEIKS